jgi:FixJ family two-component response regulator
MIAPRVAAANTPVMAVHANARSVAFVDDDELMRDALQGLLKEAGFEARAFASADEFLESGNQQDCSCLIADIRMPGMSGLYLPSLVHRR